MAMDQKEEGKDNQCSMPGLCSSMVSPTDRQEQRRQRWLKGTMPVGVTEEGMCKGQISSRELGMAGSIGDEGSNILWRGMGTSSTWPKLPDYFRKPTERPVGERAPLGFSEDASWGLNKAQEEEEEGGPGGSMS